MGLIQTAAKKKMRISVPIRQAQKAVIRNRKERCSHAVRKAYPLCVIHPKILLKLKQPPLSGGVAAGSLASAV